MGRRTLLLPQTVVDGLAGSLLRGRAQLGMVACRLLGANVTPDNKSSVDTVSPGAL
jgi:hypothetical protein